MEAYPQFKMVTLYDAHLKRVPKEELRQYQAAHQTEHKEQNQEQKEEIKKDVKQKKAEGVHDTKKRAVVKKESLLENQPGSFRIPAFIIKLNR